MDIKEINLNDEVICIKITGELSHNEHYRTVGHIGKISSILPLLDIVYISHIEEYSDGAREYLTPFFVEELEPYLPPEANIRKAIAEVKMNLD
mgnify:CR=1 FL=1